MSEVVISCTADISSVRKSVQFKLVPRRLSPSGFEATFSVSWQKLIPNQAAVFGRNHAVLLESELKTTVRAYGRCGKELSATVRMWR